MLESPGPVLFRQRRAGRDRKTIRVFKFRSMYRDAVPKNSPCHATLRGLGVVLRTQARGAAAP